MHDSREQVDQCQQDPEKALRPPTFSIGLYHLSAAHPGDHSDEESRGPAQQNKPIETFYSGNHLPFDVQAFTIIASGRIGDGGKINGLFESGNGIHYPVDDCICPDFDAMEYEKTEYQGKWISTVNRTMNPPTASSANMWC